MYLKSILSLFLSLIALLAPACSSCQVRVGFAGSHSGGRMDYHYTVFTGQEQKTLNLEQGQVLDLAYDIDVEDGLVSLKLAAPDGEVVWEANFEEDGSGAEEILIESDGLYQIMVSGSRAIGGFEVDWELQ